MLRCVVLCCVMAVQCSGVACAWYGMVNVVLCCDSVLWCGVACAWYGMVW